MKIGVASCITCHVCFSFYLFLVYGEVRRGVDKKEKLSFEIVRSCHAELTRKLAEIKSMRNFLFLLGVSASLTGVSERLFCTALSKGEREIVFELIAKSCNFERGFFIESKSILLPSPPPWGGNNDHVILSRAKYLKPTVFNFTPLPSPSPLGGEQRPRHTEQSEVSQAVLVLLNPSPYPSPHGEGN